MNQANQDGRIVLCKNTLKSLRRKNGVSQEQMAFLCADKGLCVSVASIKRAETSKNVLYRTAKDISLFFEVDISELRDQNEENLSAAETSDTASVEAPLSIINSDLNINRYYILLTFDLIENTLSEKDRAKIFSRISDYSKQYDANEYTIDSVKTSTKPSTEKHLTLYYTFGWQVTKGNEIQRALNFSFNCLEHLKPTNTQAKIVLHCSQTDFPENSSKPENTILNTVTACQDQTNTILKQAPAYCVCIDEELKASIRETFDYMPLLRTDDGKQIWQVLDTFNMSTAKALDNFVGRRVEIIQFQALLESAKEYGTAQLAYLTGPAGIGKSRLAQEYCLNTINDNFKVHSMAIFDYDIGEKQQTIPQLLRSLLDLKTQPTTTDPEDIDIPGQLTWLKEPRHLPLLYSLLNWEMQKSWSTLLETMTTERLFLAQSSLIISIIKTKLKNNPLLITIEDYHWADKNLQRHIRQLILHLQDFPIVFLFTSRQSDELSTLISENEVDGLANTVINLSPLSKKDASHLADTFHDVNPEYKQKCIEKAQGNPLFLEQLLKDKNKTLNSNLPFSLQSLIAARIDSMDKKDQFAVRVASVIGPQFSLDILRSLLQDKDYEISPLIYANLIHRKDDGYAFNHILILEGIYFSISEANRNKFHYMCSERLQQDIVLQCHHLLKGNHVDAVSKITPAIKHLIQTFKFDKAKNLIDIGLNRFSRSEITSTLYGLDAEVEERLGDTQRALHAYKTQLKHSINSIEKVNTLIAIANCLNTLDQSKEAHTTLDEAHRISIENQFTSQLSRIYYLNGNFLFPKGEVEACFEYQEQALQYARKAKHSEMEARALGGLGDAAYAKGRMLSANIYFSSCLDLCNQHDLKQVSAANLFMLGTVSIYQNKTNLALSVTEQSIVTAELVGHKRAEIVSRLTAGWILLDWLRLDEALEHINTGLNIATEIGAKRFVPFLLESKARYYYFNSDKSNAIECIDNAIDKLSELKANTFIGPWLIGTRATFSNDWNTASTYLKSGSDLLAKGAIGHNHYRFYVAAIETCLTHHKHKEAQDFINELKNFTSDEETPWSNFYIERAEFLIKNQKDKSEANRNELNQLIKTAKEAKLLSALPFIENMLCDTLAL